MTEVKCDTCGEAEAIREIGAQWCHEAGVQEARAAAAEARIALLERALQAANDRLREMLAAPAARKDKES